MNTTFDTLADATNKSLAYARIAANNSQQPWRAVHAQIWADLSYTIATTQSTDPLKELSLAHESIDTRSTLSPRNTVQAWRDTLRICIPEELQENWLAGLAPIDYLPDHASSTPATELDLILIRQLASRDPHQRIKQLIAAAEQQGAHARTTETFGHTHQAIRHAYYADLAAFASWTLQRSLYYNDTAFVQADLMWELLKLLITEIPELPPSLPEAIRAIRSRELWTAAPYERASLLEYLENTTGLTHKSVT